METEAQSPDFESIKQISPYGAGYWSARDLVPLLGYDKWQNFDIVIRRAMTICTLTNLELAEHFSVTSKVITVGFAAKREVIEKGKYSAKKITQVCFIQANQQQKLALAASEAGVLSPNFGVFQEAGYKGLYSGLGTAAIKKQKQIDQREDLLDRMGRAELAANDFRITQTEERLRRKGAIGQPKAIQTHHEVGKTVRKAIEEIGGTMPEELPPEPSLKPLRDAKHRKQKKLSPPHDEDDIGTQDTLWQENR